MAQTPSVWVNALPQNVEGAKVKSSNTAVSSSSLLRVAIVALAAPDTICLVPVKPFPVLRRQCISVARSNRSVNGGDAGCEINGSAGCSRAGCKA